MSGRAEAAYVNVVPGAMAVKMSARRQLMSMLYLLRYRRLNQASANVRRATLRHYATQGKMGQSKSERRGQHCLGEKVGVWSLAC